MVFADERDATRLRSALAGFLAEAHLGAGQSYVHRYPEQFAVPVVPVRGLDGNPAAHNIGREPFEFRYALANGCLDHGRGISVLKADFQRNLHEFKPLSRNSTTVASGQAGVRLAHPE
jgi:hypothetical protein